MKRQMYENKLSWGIIAQFPVSFLGIEITSSAPITVQAATLTLRSSDTALILPTAALGVEYVVMSYMYNDVEVDLNIIYVSRVEH